MAECQQCKKKIGGLFGASMVEKKAIDFIKKLEADVSGNICKQCMNILIEDLLKSKNNALKTSNNKLKKEFQDSIYITTFPPDNTIKYEHKCIVTASTALGTGVISEFLGSITDFFGMESETYNNKIKLAEESCLDNIRSQALINNANAIVGLNIICTELTHANGMLLLHMSGTAINIVDKPQSKDLHETLMKKNEELALAHNKIKELMREFEEIKAESPL